MAKSLLDARRSSLAYWSVDQLDPDRSSTRADPDHDDAGELNPLRISRRSPGVPTPDRQSLESFPLGTSPQARAIRRRLMERVADADESHLTIDGNAGEWQPFLDGVAIKVLHENTGVLSYLLRLDAGAVLSPHRHPHDEECVVLEGRLRVGSKIAIGPGGYHLAHGARCTPRSPRTRAQPSSFGGAVPHVSQMLG